MAEWQSELPRVLSYWVQRHSLSILRYRLFASWGKPVCILSFSGYKHSANRVSYYWCDSFQRLLDLRSLKLRYSTEAVHSIYLKILVNYFQLVFLVTEFRLNWPGPVLKLLDAQNSTGGVTQQIYSIDCLLAENTDTSEIFFEKQVFMALLPLGVIVGVVLFWLVRAVISRKAEYMHREMTASIVIAFFFIHPTLTIPCSLCSAALRWVRGSAD